MAYYVWPMAVYALFEPRTDVSHWYRFHLRQSLWFGLMATLVAFVAFAWPLLASVFLGNPIVTIWVYVVAMVVDVALFVLWLRQAMRYSQRAGRGELFEIAWVARLTGTQLPK